jgi:hypothetical protein
MKKSVLVLFALFGVQALKAQINNPGAINNPNTPEQITPSTPNQPGIGTNALDLNIPSGTQTTPGSISPGLNTTPSGTQPPFGSDVSPGLNTTTPGTQNPNGNTSPGINNNGLPNPTFPQNTPPRK